MDAVVVHPLREFRLARGLSRAELATLLGMTVAMVGHVERGVRRVRPETALRLQEERGVPAAVLRPDLFGLATIKGGDLQDRPASSDRRRPKG